MKDILSKALMSIVLSTAAFLANACYSLQVSGLDASGKGIRNVATIAVAGFSAGMKNGDRAGRIRSSLTGYVFDAEPIPEGVSDRLNDLLFNDMVGIEGLALYSPAQTAAVAAGVIRTQEGLTMDQSDLYKEIGRLLNADAVLVGFIYRWREREGKEYGVSSAASVAFELQLLATQEGSVIWRGKFDKTQRSLSEDLFDFRTFMKARGKWLNAEQLALTGLRALIERLKSEITAGTPEVLEAEENF